MTITTTPLTVALAAELGWVVEEGTDGAWGHAATRVAWRIKQAKWPQAVWHAFVFDTEGDALGYVASDVASRLGVTREQFDEHLSGILTRREAA